MAQAVFIEQGDARAMMDVIARAARASRKTIYARYTNKAEVLAALFERLLQAATPDESSPADLPSSRMGDARARLLRLGRQLAATVMTPVAAESHQFPEVVRVASQLQGLAIEGMRRALERLRDDGQLPGLTDPVRAARIFVEMAVSVQRGSAILGRPIARRDGDSLVKAAVTLFRDGCERVKGQFSVARREKTISY